MSALLTVADDLSRDLGNGLILRRSTSADAEALAEFNKWIHRDTDVVEPDEPVAEWTRELLSGQHPTFGERDFTIVAEKDTGRIVSTLNLISQWWTYSGIPIGVGRIELVGTAPEYRKRGLIRLQFDAVHQLSADRREQVQAITGIPYYYRQFGYEMAMDLGGSRIGYLPSIPALKVGQVEPVSIRQVTETDLDFVIELDRLTGQQSLVYAPRDARLWHYEIFERAATSIQRLEWRIVQLPSGERIGLIAFSPLPWGGSRLGVHMFQLAPGRSYVQTAASVLRAMQAEGEAVMAAKGKALSAVQFGLGDHHPFYEANQERLPHVRASYAWYLRVPDLTGFIRTIVPALEERLARSFAAGHSGELKLGFYRSGLRLVLEQGRFVTIEPWTPVLTQDEGHAAFPGLTFLQLLFGYRTFGELRQAFADVWAADDETRGLLAALFPRLRSYFIPIS